MGDRRRRHPRAAAEPPDHRRRRRGSGHRPGVRARARSPRRSACHCGPLEVDLWVDPLRDGVREALRITGARSPRQLRQSPAVVTVGGRVAADLDLLGLVAAAAVAVVADQPGPAGPALEGGVAGRAAAGRPAGAGRRPARRGRRRPRLAAGRRHAHHAELVRLLRRSRQTLTALHGHEVLAGLLLDDVDAQPTAASAALRVLAQTAGSTVDDEELVASHPVLLSLVPPRIGGTVSLPPPPASLPVAPAPAGREAAVREALRLRARWVQELTARAALALGGRLVDRGVLTERRRRHQPAPRRAGRPRRVGWIAVALPRPPRGRRAGTAAAGVVPPHRRRHRRARRHRRRRRRARCRRWTRRRAGPHRHRRGARRRATCSSCARSIPALASDPARARRAGRRDRQRAVAPGDPRPRVRRADRRRPARRHRALRRRHVGPRRRHDRRRRGLEAGEWGAA